VRKKKPSGQPKRGPFTSDDVKRMLKKDGWTSRSGGDHQSVWEHETKPGKIPVSEAWTGLRAKCPILKGMARTMGLSDDEVLKLLQ
jgi:hypothetical protein